jgi:hypothetical protein
MSGRPTRSRKPNKLLDGYVVNIPSSRTDAAAPEHETGQALGAGPSRGAVAAAEPAAHDAAQPAIDSEGEPVCGTAQEVEDEPAGAPGTYAMLTCVRTTSQVVGVCVVS